MFNRLTGLFHLRHKKSTIRTQYKDTYHAESEPKQAHVFCEIDSGRPSEINLDKSAQIYQNRFFEAAPMRKTRDLEYAIANFLYYHNVSQISDDFSSQRSTELLNIIEKLIESGAEINKKPYGYYVLANYNSFLRSSRTDGKNTISAQYVRLIELLINKGIDLKQTSPDKITLNIKLIAFKGDNNYRKRKITGSITNTFPPNERNLSYVDFIEKVFNKEKPKTIELLGLFESATAKQRLEMK